MKIYGVIQNGVFEASPEQDRIEKHYLSNIKDGTLVERETKKFRQSKTLQQTKAYWGLAITLIETEFKDRGWDTSFLLRLNKETGIACDKDLIYVFLCNACPVFENSQRITLSKMSIEQCIKFFENCCAFAATQWNIFIPPPDKNWRENGQ